MIRGRPDSNSPDIIKEMRKMLTPVELVSTGFFNRGIGLGAMVCLLMLGKFVECFKDCEVTQVLHNKYSIAFTLYCSQAEATQTIRNGKETSNFS